jgi:hypothetical protein
MLIERLYGSDATSSDRYPLSGLSQQVLRSSPSELYVTLKSHWTMTGEYIDEDNHIGGHVALLHNNRFGKSC